MNTVNSMVDMSKVAVVGSGITGLSAARLLENMGHEVSIFESSFRKGGRLFSEDFAGDPLEWGPSTLLGNHEKFDELVALAGIEDKIKVANPEAKNRQFVM